MYHSLPLLLKHLTNMISFVMLATEVVTWQIVGHRSVTETLINVTRKTVQYNNTDILNINCDISTKLGILDTFLSVRSIWFNLRCVIENMFLSFRCERTLPEQSSHSTACPTG